MTFYLSHLVVRYQFSYQIVFHLILNQGNLVCEIGSFIALPTLGRREASHNISPHTPLEVRRCATSGRKYAVWTDSQILPQRHAMSRRRPDHVLSTDFPL